MRHVSSTKVSSEPQVSGAPRNECKVRATDRGDLVAGTPGNAYRWSPQPLPGRSLAATFAVP